jgi:phage shock protein PspC (stress-responsive transcriptional regulator)
MTYNSINMSCDPSSGNLNLVDCLILNPDGDGDGVATTVAGVYDTPAVIVNVIVRNLFVFGGMVLFFMIILAGFKFAMSPQSKGKEDAKNIIQGAGIGFLIMFSAYWIIQILEILTGIENII